MTAESEPSTSRLPIRALSPFVISFEGLPLPAVEQERLLPIGGIFYGDGKRIVLLREDEHENLHCEYQITPEGFSIDNIVEGKGRFLQFGTYDEVLVVQVGMTDQAVRSYSSVRTIPSVSVRLDYVDPATQERGRYTTDEEIILRVFTGEQGGIALFEGAGLPEEVAFVISREVEGKKLAVVFFVHPAESGLIDSVTGFSQFLRILNEEFMKVPVALQAKALKELERVKTKGYISFESPVREELYTTIVIANARLAHRNGRERYKSFIQEHFPRTGRRFLVFGEMGRQERMQQVNNAIDSLILGVPLKTTEADTSPEVKFDGKKIFLELIRALESQNAVQTLNHQFRTYDSGSGRSNFEEYFGLDNEKMRGFIKDLLKFIYEAKTPEEFRDAEAMLATVMNTPFAGSAIVDYDLLIYESEKGPQLIFYNRPGDNMNSPSRRFNSRPVGGYVLIEELTGLLNAKKSAIPQGVKSAPIEPPN